MKLRTRIEVIRDSSFLIPVVLIALSLALVALTTQLDEHVTDMDLLIPAKIGGARTLLATIAGAIITAAALVFSFSAITVQLAASQYSPRVVQEFLRDRVQQSIVGLVMATFTYALTSLATLGSDASDEARADWTATTAVVLGVASAISIVAFIDHVTRRIRIDDTVRRIGQRTVEAFQAVASAEPSDVGGWHLQPTTEASALRADATGFVQEVDVPALLAELSPGMIGRLDVWVGDFVSEGVRLITVWTEDGTAAPASLAETIAIGETRTIDQDPAHGIRQLVDIALRALSPGINDPATAADVTRHLARCVRAAHIAGTPQRIWVAPNGARLVAPHAADPADQVARAFPPVRRAAVDQPMVLEAMVEALDALADDLAGREIDATAIRRELAAAQAALAEHAPSAPIS